MTFKVIPKCQNFTKSGHTVLYSKVDVIEACTFYWNPFPQCNITNKALVETRAKSYIQNFRRTLFCAWF